MKEKFFYNTQTLRYEKIEISLKTKIFRGVGIFTGMLVGAAILATTLYHFYPSPKENALNVQIQQLELQNMKYGEQVDLMAKVLDNVHQRDAGVYRMMFGMDPMDDAVWNGGIGGHDKYAELRNLNSSGEILAASQEKADRLKLKLSLESKSLDELEQLAKDKETMLASIPAIKPVREDKLNRNIRALSGFGMRMHPVYKRMKRHTGIDFSCPKGVDIQATGDGVIEAVYHKRTGYGTHVIINHGYGYKSLYGHMSTVDVKKGQKVKRGQLLGKVGSTGTSTAPHCHYEVHKNGIKINPINYCLDGLTPEEYQDLANDASVVNQSFD